MPDENGQTEISTNGTTKQQNSVSEIAHVPSFRLKEESDRRRAAETKAQALEQQLQQLQGEYEKTKNGMTQIQSQHAQDMHLIGLGFQAQSVRRFFRREYQDSVAELAPDQRPGFEDWLNASKDDPLYSVHFERIASTEQTKTPDFEPVQQSQNNTEALIAAMQQALGANPNNGANSPAAHNGRQFSKDEINAIRGKNAGTLGAHRDQIINQLRNEGLLK